MNDKLIRRMINKGFTDDEIVSRLRCKLELVVAIRELIEIENKRSHIVPENNWDE